MNLCDHREHRIFSVGKTTKGKSDRQKYLKTNSAEELTGDEFTKKRAETFKKRGLCPVKRTLADDRKTFNPNRYEYTPRYMRDEKKLQSWARDFFCCAVAYKASQNGPSTVSQKQFPR